MNIFSLINRVWSTMLKPEIWMIIDLTISFLIFFYCSGEDCDYCEIWVLLLSNPLLGPDFTLSTVALILSILDWLATTILLPQMLFSNFDFLQQNFAVISKTFLDNSDSATVSVLSHSGPARTLQKMIEMIDENV